MAGLSLAGAAVLAQEVGTEGAESAAAPSGNPNGPTITRPDITPYIFEPDIYTVPTPFDIARSLNTPSGLAPFSNTRAVPRGLQFTISEGVRYDDNVLRLPKGAFVGTGRSRSDVFSVTNVGASYSREIGLQTVFVQGDYGINRYRTNTQLDVDRYRFAAGINWALGSTCSGVLVGSISQSETSFEDLAVGAPANSLTKTELVDFRGRCHVYGDFFATYGAGFQTSAVNTSPLNDSEKTTARVGLEYAVPQLYTLGFETVFTQTDFTNRTATATNPVTTDLGQIEYRAYYTYIISPKTSISVNGGILQSDASSAFGSSTQDQSVGGLTFNWRPTPKLLLTLGAQIAATPAQSLDADYQRSRVASMALLYNISPKLNVSAAYAITRSTQATSSGTAGFVNDREQRLQSFSVDANYQLSPFVIAALGYRFLEQSDRLSTQDTVSNVYTVSLNYRR